MAKRSLLIYIIFIICLSGWWAFSCTKLEIREPTVSSSPVVTPIETITPIPLRPSVTPTWTPTSAATLTPEHTPTQTHTATSLPDPISFQCLDITPALPANAQSSGVIALFVGSSTIMKNGLLLDLETGKLTSLAKNQNESISYVSISPDGQRLAYRKSIEQSGEYQRYLVIATLEDVIQTIPWKDSWSQMRGWLDNNRLLFSHNREPHNSIIVFDSFDDQSEQELMLEAPYIMVYNAPVFKGREFPPSSFNPIAFVYYDPSLTRAAFLQAGDWTSLIDLQTGEVLAQLPNVFNISTMAGFTSLDLPVWSVKGDEFLVEAGRVDQSELYSVSRDGEITRLTYLTETYQFSRVVGYSPSFDGRYIVFWYWADPYDSYRLAMLDVKTEKIIDFCVEGIGSGQISTPGWAVWSPDSYQFSVEVHNRDLSNSKVIWVDVENWSAAQIAENVSPVGWMK